MSKNPIRNLRFDGWKALPVALAAVTAFAAVAAAQTQQPGLIGEDDRKPVAGTGQPWDAVGQVNIGGYRSIGQCTGTLVRADVVVTAAHCVMDDAKAKPHPSHNIHFIAGVSGEKYLAHAKAKCVRFLKGYAYVPVRDASGVPLSALYQDVAAIVLTTKLALEPAAVADLRPRDPGESLVHAAYPSIAAISCWPTSAAACCAPIDQSPSGSTTVTPIRRVLVAPFSSKRTAICASLR